MDMRHTKSSEIRNDTPDYFHIFEDRTSVAHPSHFPYRSVGHVVVELSNGERLVGPGTMLSDFTVLASAHLVKNTENLFLDIARLFFVPAKRHLTQPYGIFDWTHIRAFRDDRNDWALISLAEPAGRAVGTFGAYAKSSSEDWRDEKGLSFFPAFQVTSIRCKSRNSSKFAIWTTMGI